MCRAGQVVVAQQGTAHSVLPGSRTQGGVRRRVFQLCQQVQTGVQPRKGQLFRCKGTAQRRRQCIPAGFVGGALPRQMPGEIPPGDKARQRLLLKPSHRAGVELVFFLPRTQQLPGQHHVGDADARGKAAGAGGQVHHRAVCARHALQAGQRAGVETELRVVVVLNDVPPPRGAGCPVQQFCPASGGHGDPGGKLVAGGDIAHRRIAGGKGGQRQPVRVHRQTAAGHTVVFQHLPGAGVAGGLHGGRAGQQRCQQPQQIFQPCTHHQLLRVALHAPVLGQIPCQRLPQGGIAPGIPGGEQFRRGVEQLLLQPRPCAEGEQPRVHAPGG